MHFIGCEWIKIVEMKTYFVVYEINRQVLPIVVPLDSVHWPIRFSTNQLHHHQQRHIFIDYLDNTGINTLRPTS